MTLDAPTQPTAPAEILRQDPAIKLDAAALPTGTELRPTVKGEILF